jgi:hypothetical protein
MKNPAIGVLSALIELLDGNLSYQGANIPVFTSVPANAGEMYVYFDGLQFEEDLTKEDFGGILTLDMRVVTRMHKNMVSRLPAHTITGQALNLVKPNRTSRLTFNDGLLDLHALVRDTQEFDEYDGDEIIVSNLVTWRFIYQEVSAPVSNDFLLAETGSFLLAGIGSKIKV